MNHLERLARAKAAIDTVARDVTESYENRIESLKELSDLIDEHIEELTPEDGI